MKNLFKSIIYLVSIFLMGCDDYSETKIFFSSDKSEYTIGDNIILSLNIKPLKAEKQIKIYSDLSNVKIDGYLKYNRNPNDDIQYRFRKIKKIINAEENRKIHKYNISSKNPLEYTIKGKVTQNDTAYIIDFSSIKTKFYINKIEYSEAEIFGFEGFCEPINAPFGYSYEDFIDFIPIVIKE